MRAATSDLWVFDQIFLYKEMETDFGKDVAFIIDAEANIGLTSAYFAHRFPNARILALEVDRQNFELLAANIRPYPNITPLLKGLWYRRATLIIDDPEEYPWAFTVSGAPGDRQGAKVKLLNRKGIDSKPNWPRVMRSASRGARRSVDRGALLMAALVSPMMESTSKALGGGLLLIAGLFQFSRLKYACLAHCRSQWGFSLRNGDMAHGCL
jgi:Predicted metal-binding integral membrane protein (DUF2182)